MRRWKHKVALSVLFCFGAITNANSAGKYDSIPQQGKTAQGAMAEYNGMQQVNGVKTLQDYIVQEEEDRKSTRLNSSH